jgi:hypothetical protein
LYNQVDHFFVYLNDYDHVPDYLFNEKISYYRSQDFIDLSANGKVFFIDYVEKGYFFTIDDDWLFPSNYISKMIDTIKKYGGQVCTCVHGSIFPPEPKYYYFRTAMHQYSDGLRRDAFVCLPGSGSFGYDVAQLKAKFKDFLPMTMVDLTFAILAKQQEFPIVSVQRPLGWLQNTDILGLFQEFNHNRTHHSYYAERWGPWGINEYRAGLERALSHACGKDLTLNNDSVDLEVLRYLQTGEVPYKWSENAEYIKRFRKYSNLVG